VDGKRFIRARHPNADPDTDLHPTGYIPMEHVVRKEGRWMPAPAWQTVPPKLIEIQTPNWYCWGSFGSNPCFNFTSSGGMSPYYQARQGGAMDRFVGGLAPGPTRSTCYEGCSVSGGVWYYSKAAFNSSSSSSSSAIQPPWRDCSTGIVHAMHPLNTRWRRVLWRARCCTDQIGDSECRGVRHCLR
jgi:hypothetical protein